ncbi:MAG: hypothetical protein H7A55_18130 [Verrucomicrobiaceae bacterium]|nr:hypothetical protein [Verrucomicrobiaceae bacterium]
MSRKPQPHNEWVKSIGVGWLWKLAYFTDFGPVVAVLFIGAWLFFDVGWCIYAGLGIIGLAVVSTILYAHLFYRVIRCPICGHNPTRTKLGRERKNHRATETIVSKHVECPRASQHPSALAP